MTTGQLITTAGRKLAINRTFKGTPDYLAVTHFKVGTGTTAPTVGDTDLQTSVHIAGASHTKDIATGYPVLDESNMQSTIRCIVLTTEANSNDLTEFGLFNEDASPIMFSRAVHTAITKTSSVQVIYVEKDKII
jgi:hypothetical protein